MVFLFLRNFKATLVPTVCVPLSLLGTFGVMYLLGFSLDNFSLMALIVSTGFVVDNTIVVLENVTRHLENGEDRMTAALQGRRRSQLHRAVHEHLAGGGVLPGAADRRHRGAHLPRIRRDPDHRHRHVADRVADRDADDVRLSGFHGQRGPELADALVAPHLGSDAGFLPPHPDLVAGQSQDHHGDAAGRGRAECLSAGDRAQGLLPRYRQRHDLQGGIRGDQSISFQSMQKKFQQFINIIKADPAVATVGGFAGGQATNSGQCLRHPEAAGASAACPPPR